MAAQQEGLSSRPFGNNLMMQPHLPMEGSRVPVAAADAALNEIFTRLVAAYEPERIYLFGSKAGGGAGSDTRPSRPARHGRFSSGCASCSERSTGEQGIERPFAICGDDDLVRGTALVEGAPGELDASGLSSTSRMMPRLRADSQLARGRR
jgi:hypothetical protein